MTADEGPGVEVPQSGGADRTGRSMRCRQCRNVFEAIGDCFNKQALSKVPKCRSDRHGINSLPAVLKEKLENIFRFRFIKNELRFAKIA